jgi:hypothetical protein
MTILFVAMSNSIHTARWISQIEDQGWDLHLFPSIDTGTSHSDLKKVTIHETFYTDRARRNSSVTTRGIPISSTTLVSITKRLLRKTSLGVEQSKKLAKLIRNLKPDIIHSMEIQHAGYLTLEAKERFNGDFPPWIVTNWGSDIFLFGQLKNHKHRIRKVLENCEFYSCECSRDVKLAKEFGFAGEVLPVIPNTGGFDLNLLSSLRQAGATSSRRLIMLKGYQGLFGRSLVGLRALELCVDLLHGYEIAIYSASQEVKIAAEIFSESTGIPVTIIPHGTKHLNILRLHGQARISIGLSIGDAISTSFLEALVMGSFPIQSNTSSCDEWIEDGKTSFIVPPEDPDVIENAIRKSLTDDNLVDKAAEINYETAKEKLDYSLLKAKAIEMYETVAAQSGVFSKIA